MMTTFFTDGEVTDFASASRSDTERYGRFFHGMLNRGVYLAPSQFEAAFLSLCHGDAEIDATVAAARETLAEIAG
jgi:glutamate-1-semialdehyde 2,1-aminomutase